MAIGGVSESAGLVRFPVRRPNGDDNDRAGLGLLRIGPTARCASLLFGAVRPSPSGDLPDLRLRPHAILGSAHDVGSGSQPYHERLRHHRALVSV